VERPTALQIVDGVDLSGKMCVITGATSGLGRESARALASAGAHVVLGARNPDALAEAQSWIRAEVPDAATTTVRLDLTSLAGVRAAATAIQQIAPAIHVLMNNAGVMFTPFGRTADGFEIQFGTNHLGHFELTRLLIPQLLAAGGCIWPTAGSAPTSRRTRSTNSGRPGCGNCRSSSAPRRFRREMGDLSGRWW